MAMRMHLTLDENTVADVSDRAPAACAYWQPDAEESERLPSKAKLRAALRKPLEVGPTLLRTIANDDAWSVDTLVQLALFGELRFG